MGLTFRQSQKGKTFGVCLGRWHGCSVKKGKGNFLYSAVSIPQKNVSTDKVSPCNLCCAAPFGTQGVLPHYQNKVETLKTMAYPVIWHIKPKALKMESLLNTFADGGLNIVDIRTKI